MTPTTFTKAIEQFFLQPDTPIQLNQFEEVLPSSDISREITIDNLQPVSARLLNTLNAANDQIQSGTIALVDLMKLRAQFYEAREHLVQLEKKELQDVIDLKNSTKWHERSKFVRIFVNSDVGDQLDQEEAEAKEVSSTKVQFFEKLEDLESMINYHIISTGERSSPAFKEMIAQWRTIGQMEKDARKSIDFVNAAYNSLPSGNMCMNCGRSTSCNTNRSERYMASASSQLKNQLNTLTPWYDRLTVQVEDTIDRARAAVKIPK